jgi:hypothetical protein
VGVGGGGVIVVHLTVSAFAYRAEDNITNWNQQVFLRRFESGTSRLYIRIAKYFTVIIVMNHNRWVPCHHDMTRPQVKDGGKASRYGG